MKIKLLCVGDKMPAWVDTAYKDYASRLSKNYKMELKQIALLKRSKHQISQLIEKETQLLHKNIAQQDYVVALEVTGKEYDTPTLSKRLEHWQGLGQNLVFVIGGPEGLHPSILQRANEKWSLSKLTLPHPMVRVIMMEQLYRAWSILNNHPYHRE